MQKNGERFDVVSIKESGTEENSGGKAKGSRDKIVELLLWSDMAGSPSEGQRVKFSQTEP